jgi:hypothetical protein
MEGLLASSGFAAMVAAAPTVARFGVVDVGCSSGIDAAWRGFGEKLVAFGFDPNVAEVERLAAAETLPGVRYVAGFVGVPDDLPFTRARAGRGPWSRSPMERLSVMRSLELMKRGALSQEEKTQANLWADTRLADPGTPVLLREFLPAQGVDDLDVLKIDIDSMDMGVLQSVGDQLADWRVLAVGLEVNYFGSDDDSDHTLHAMDRFMRARGFDLFDLTVRRYSHAALPAPYVGGLPGQSVFGRPVQGDALYLRDPCAAEPLSALPADKLAKLAAIASLAGLPDFAAEILLKHREALAGMLDVERGLDLLAAQAQPVGRAPMSYRDYMAAFERGDPMFLHGGPAGVVVGGSGVDLQRRLAAMEASTSWKITAPLRWVVGKIKGK